MEYQAKELFAKHGVATTLGTVVETAEEAKAAAEQSRRRDRRQGAGQGRRPRQGRRRQARQDPGRGVRARDEHPRPGDQGPPVNRVLVTPATPPEEEYYFSFLLDRSNRQYLCIASVEGGVEIEEVAKTNPDAVKKIAIDPGKGVDAAKAREIATEAGFPEAVFEQAVTMIEKLYTVFVEEDATLVEVNPLARLAGDKLEAWTARSRSTRTPPRSATPTTSSSRSPKRPTRSRPRPRRSASTT
jgi:succinyl-CoA synthetase beta subunit